MRRWQVLPNTPDSFRGVRHGDLDLVLKNEQLKWNPAYSQVSGSLPIAELPFFELSNHTTQTLLRFQLDVTTAGPFELLLPGEGIFRLWVEGRVAKAGRSIAVGSSHRPAHRDAGRRTG